MKKRGKGPIGQLVQYELPSAPAPAGGLMDRAWISSSVGHSEVKTSLIMLLIRFSFHLGFHSDKSTSSTLNF
jgi:hypothetical protein